ncbi:MAG: hypothetical protein LUG19_01610 [Desulfovibrio sp.]|uniref:hypothetical protein n=1 Tax=Desulfovibrio sp. TaxID=885 RepID=UPI00259015A8|nr:hypothetical protein [Desulfovibrio sp.]MCD7982936.1 hypothetical protein [Desulfovibrio sp.]
MVAEADFANSEVTAGAGRDSLHGVVWGDIFDLGEGDDNTDGVFSQTVILGGGGKDTLRADYADGASFDTGDGEGDVVDLATGVNNTVSAGEGGNTISMGRNGVSDQARTWQTAEEHALRTRPTQTGEIARNTVIAASSESTIVINNGKLPGMSRLPTAESRPAPKTPSTTPTPRLPKAGRRRRWAASIRRCLPPSTATVS